MVSVFSFQHWKCHFRHTQNLENLKFIVWGSQKSNSLYFPQSCLRHEKICSIIYFWDFLGVALAQTTARNFYCSMYALCTGQHLQFLWCFGAAPYWKLSCLESNLFWSCLTSLDIVWLDADADAFDPEGMFIRPSQIHAHIISLVNMDFLSLM